MIKTDKIAVVILNWNGRDMMRRFLPSVVKNSQPEGGVIVADNGSTDESLQMLTEEFPEVLQLPLPQNYGFAEGYNQALKQLDAPYYLLLNSDVEVPEHWLTPLLAYMEAHPETAACQPKLLSQKDKTMFEYAGGAVLLMPMATLFVVDVSSLTSNKTKDNTTPSARCFGPQAQP